MLASNEFIQKQYVDNGYVTKKPEIRINLFAIHIYLLPVTSWETVSRNEYADTYISALVLLFWVKINSFKTNKYS